ncbi:MAG: sensor domain-containing diguanylate cyclase [Alcaligenaceae bacterium]|nr:sensor domain-containing diguanylate cyclase [Alcaligenaceae bacterium]
MRIHHAFSLLAANLPEDLVQACKDHMQWMYEAISLILGRDIKNIAHIPSSTECRLSVWLNNGGRSAIPADQLNHLEIAHHQVHDLAAQVREEVMQQRTEHIFSLLDDLESASRTIGQILLRCIDESISNFASHDTLTKLRNRTTLVPVFEREVALAKRHKKNMGVIILDIDHFKRINDQYGHLFGDQVLIELGACLKQHIRQEDVLFRWGGEEFLILGLTTPEIQGNITALAERIRLAVQENIFCQDSDTPVQFTISAGVVEFELSSEQPMNRIFEEADKLLYQAKAGGRNRVVSEFLATP